MKRREFLCGMAVSLGAAALPGRLAGAPAIRTRSQGSRRPNFIFVYTDDQRYDAIHGLGAQPWLRTPNLDRMLAGGGNFRNAFVTTSLCSPSRSSFLSGCYVHRTGVINNERTSLFRSDLPCVLPLLEQAGYRRAMWARFISRIFRTC